MSAYEQYDSDRPEPVSQMEYILAYEDETTEGNPVKILGTYPSVGQAQQVAESDWSKTHNTPLNWLQFASGEWFAKPDRYEIPDRRATMYLIQPRMK